jgi:hypothetical protein
MSEHKSRPQASSTARDNFAVVHINLKTGKVRKLNDAEGAREAAEATRRAADRSKGIVAFTSGGS